MKKKHWWIGFGLLVAAAVVWWAFARNPGTQVRAKFFLNPGVHPKHKAEALKRETSSAYDRLMSPALAREKAAKAEAARLANWKANFPWQPTHDPALKFTPDKLPTSGVKRPSEDFFAWENHTDLKAFFQSELRFSPQFEQFYRILKEHDRGHNPAQIASAFWAFRKYYHSAFEHEPDEHFTWGNGEKVRKNLISYKTWGDEAEEDYESLQGYLGSWEWLRPRFETDAGEAEAIGLIGRLVKEMRGMEELPRDVSLFEIEGASMGLGTYEATFVDPLMSGEEEMLVPYVGWYEEAREYWDKQTRQFNISYAQGDPSLKAVAPELFPPVDVVEGNRLVDKDGDPIKPYEGMDLHLRTSAGEKFPLTMDEEGYLTIPTPTEIEEMRKLGMAEAEAQAQHDGGQGAKPTE
ncbi:MAG: hypothetical protein M2R45_00484 [Verrucomicrobia subdivision 3 bacterium]|nr:hypothetical protein [Limisphaerales bacterium]MCS1413638.1 hypothetical protein [Limisphaerales bacterium]